jgi:hypothetical protein
MRARDHFRVAAETLVRQGMPADEVRALLHAGDAVIVRHHLELHRERLAERLEEHRRIVDRIERLLLDRADAQPAASRTSIRVAANSSG